MPPKKVEEPERKPLIGRVGTNLKVGIVGIPNVGKSTFFNVLTKSQAAAENFPFCTIDPNENKYFFSFLLLFFMKIKLKTLKNLWMDLYYTIFSIKFDFFKNAESSTNRII